jgi:16S rRNA (guanine527-N7)-methyltransferase
VTPEYIGADIATARRVSPLLDANMPMLSRYVALVLQWQKTTNLIAPSTEKTIWTRHVADSLQLLNHAPDAKIWIDLGSGGGFPGIPIACALAATPGAHVHLVESNGKKAAFLREAARLTGAPVTVHAQRIEKFGDSFAENADVVTARALAPLKLLCDQAFPLLARGATGLFLKGQDVEAELTETAKYWTIQADLAPSRTSPDGSIVIVRRLEPRPPKSAR